MNWIFHPEYEPQVVDDHEYKQLLKNGWFDSPAKIKNVPCGTKQEEQIVLSDAQKSEIRQEVTAEMATTILPEEPAIKKPRKG